MKRPLPGIPGASLHLRTSPSRWCKIHNAIVTTTSRKEQHRDRLRRRERAETDFTTFCRSDRCYFTSVVVRFPPDERKQNVYGFTSWADDEWGGGTCCYDTTPADVRDVHVCAKYYKNRWPAANGRGEK